MNTISEMTADQIRTRLATIKREQAAHDARDFDGELAAVMRAHGDVDAIEASHLEAQRVARRLRVERTALETELPEVIKREATLATDALAKQHADLAEKASAAVAQLVDGWTGFLAGVSSLQEVQGSAAALTNEAARLVREAGAVMPAGMGYFNSAPVMDVLKNFYERQHDLARVMNTAEQAVDSGVGDYSSRFAKTVLPAEANDNQRMLARG
ncbi:hypothetical protein [Devosia sp. SD17-2]|uniref:hypothetical protein n=1 Tax=Devosia sp. SD17-2 TaxID=2976459 RepID=UPI0023D81EAD|nr:hypothetical protein [Devosia sp. SD17-2]WEJ31995.1 hypothetical protein NYQ88_13910 [Devosia sp. SD17-2]